MEEECLPQLPQIHHKEFQKHTFYFIPIAKAPSFADVFDDFDIEEALEIEREATEVDRQLREIRSFPTDLEYQR